MFALRLNISIFLLLIGGYFIMCNAQIKDSSSNKLKYGVNFSIPVTFLRALDFGMVKSLDVFIQLRKHRVSFGADIQRNGILGFQGRYQYYFSLQNRYNYFLFYNTRYLEYLAGAIPPPIGILKKTENNLVPYTDYHLYINAIGMGISHILKEKFSINLSVGGLLSRKRSFYLEEKITYKTHFLLRIGISYNLNK